MIECGSGTEVMVTDLSSWVDWLLVLIFLLEFFIRLN